AGAVPPIPHVAHAHVARIIDRGQLPDGTGYTISEPLAGEPLRRRLARDTLSADQARTVIEQLQSALDAIHAAGVAHGAIDEDGVQLAEGGAGVVARLVDAGVEPGASAEGDR